MIGRNALVRWWTWLLLPAVVAVIIILQKKLAIKLQKTKFQQLELSACSSWTNRTAKKTGCIVPVPLLRANYSVTVTKPEKVVYFTMVLKSSQFSAHHSKYVRYQVAGRVLLNGQPLFDVKPELTSFIQGHSQDWVVSRPRRLAWVKNLQPGDVLTMQVFRLELFLTRKEFELRPLFAVAKSGSYQVALVAESDNDHIMRTIKYSKLFGIGFVGLTLSWLILRTLKREIPILRSLVLAGYAIAALSFLDPRTCGTDIVPEEYFRNDYNLKTGFLFQFGLEVLLGFEPLWQFFRQPSKAALLFVPLLLSAYVLLGYHRLLHLQDYEESADVYSDGLQRVGVYYIFSGNVTRVQLLTIGFPLLFQLFAPLVGGSATPIPALIFLTFRYFKKERYVLAGFSSWDFMKQLILCFIGYLYLVSVSYRTSDDGNKPQQIPPSDPEEQAKLYSK